MGLDLVRARLHGSRFLTWIGRCSFYVARTTDTKVRCTLRRVDSIKGAAMLRERLESGMASAPPEPAVAPEVPAGAPPLFHWLGVAPGGVAESDGTE